jgi:hypothetical protein
LTVILSHECLFGCRVYSVEIHGDGRVIYDGHAFVAVCGEQTKQIPQKKIRELYQAFHDANFFR